MHDRAGEGPGDAIHCLHARDDEPAELIQVACLGAGDHVEGAGDGLGLLHAGEVDDVPGDLGGLADLGLDEDMPSPQVPTSLPMPPAAPAGTLREGIVACCSRVGRLHGRQDGLARCSRSEVRSGRGRDLNPTSRSRPGVYVGKITLLIVTERHLTGLPRSPWVLHHDYAAEPLTTQSDYGRQLGRSA